MPETDNLADVWYTFANAVLYWVKLSFLLKTSRCLEHYSQFVQYGTVTIMIAFSVGYKLHNALEKENVLKAPAP